MVKLFKRTNEDDYLTIGKELIINFDIFTYKISKKTTFIFIRLETKNGITGWGEATLTGFEKEVIDGMMGCVEIHRPLVILEINPDTQVIAEYDLRTVLEKFLNLNYKFAVPESPALVLDKKGVPNISLNMLLCPEENFKNVDKYMNYKNFNCK